MRYILKEITILVLLCALCTVSVLAKGNFVPSIEQKGAPDVVEAIDANGEDVTSWIIVTPFSDRHTLPDEKQEHFEGAYGDVDMKALHAMLEKEEHSIVESHEHLVVSDLFYVHEFEDRGMIEHPVTVTFDTGLPQHAFVAVYEYVDGQWIRLNVDIVEDASGTMVISVQVNQWGPFAIVTEQRKESSAVHSPQTGVGSVLPMAAVSAVTLLAARKKHED